jgi:transposase
LNGTSWRLRPGSTWADIPERYGPATTLLQSVRTVACGTAFFSGFLYRYRNLVERFFNKLKHFRAIATRFEKHDANDLALVTRAAARIWIGASESVS